MANKRPLATGGASGLQEIPDADTVNLPGGLSVGTSNAPNASAVVDCVSTSKGLGAPSMTNSQMLAIASPRQGLIVDNTTIDGLCYYNGANWHRLSSLAAPTIAAGAGAGSGPTISVTGNDLGGLVVLTTGTGLTAGANIFQITFNTAFSAAPVAVIFDAIEFDSKSGWVNYSNDTPSTTTCGLTLNAGRSLLASTEYKWQYKVIQATG